MHFYNGGTECSSAGYGKVLYLPLYLAMFVEPEKLPKQLIYEVDLSGLE